MVQAPLGLWHLQGSMQVLSEQLAAAVRVTAARFNCASGSPSWNAATRTDGVCTANIPMVVANLQAATM